MRKDEETLFLSKFTLAEFSLKTSLLRHLNHREN